MRGLGLGGRGGDDFCLFVCLGFFFFCSGDQLVHTNFNLKADVSPHWFNELRRLWTSIFWRIASKLVFMMGSHTMPRQHNYNQPVLSRVHGYLAVTCHLHFWHNDRGLLRATAVTRGWNGHRIRVGCARSGTSDPTVQGQWRNKNNN